MVAELPEKSLPGVYCADRLMVPVRSVEVVSLATPPVRLTVPSVVPFPLKVTEPVGVPPEDWIVAVNVTACPATEGLNDVVTVVVVEALLTRWLNVLETALDHI